MVKAVVTGAIPLQPNSNDNTGDQLTAAVADITDLRTKYTALLADVTALRTLVSAHVHGGVTAGAANTSAIAAAAALTATAVATQSLTN